LLISCLQQVAAGTPSIQEPLLSSLWEQLRSRSVKTLYHSTIHVLFAKTWLLQADARDRQKGVAKKGRKSSQAAQCMLLINRKQFAC